MTTPLLDLLLGRTGFADPVSSNSGASAPGEIS
jgi:hypothetical protein